MRAPKIEIRTIEQMERFRDDTTTYRRIAIQGLDLATFERFLLKVNLKDFWFLGCHLPKAVAERAGAQGAVVLPELKDFTFQPFRTALYSVDELFEQEQHEDCLDSRIYRSVFKNGKRRPASLDTTVARRIHDSSISEALRWFLEATMARACVAITGSHGIPRGHAAYGQVARLAYRLTQEGYLVLSGGGPGMMEAANLGAFLSRLPVPEFDQVLGEFQKVPGQVFSHPHWLADARHLRAQYVAVAGTSVGIPTWFYGHEPPNLFATGHAKYFDNSPREEGLLALAGGGVIFTEGNAGTVQEIFQDACQNYYRTYDDRANPMVLFGPGYWTDTREDGEGLPVYQLLNKLGMKSPDRFAEKILLTGDVEKTVAFMGRFNPAAAT